MAIWYPGISRTQEQLLAPEMRSTMYLGALLVLFVAAAGKFSSWAARRVSSDCAQHFHSCLA